MRGIRIRPDEKGLRTALFDLEADIMQVVWKKNWPEFTVADVHHELQRRREIAYTTVMTILVRLWRKELVGRERRGRAYAYEPSISPEERTASRMAELLDAASDPALALTRFVAELDAQQRDTLRTALARLRRKR